MCAQEFKMKTKKELRQINKEHFKDRPNSVRFCMDCDLVKKEYCSECANRQINRLDKISMGVVEK